MDIGLKLSSDLEVEYKKILNQCKIEDLDSKQEFYDLPFDVLDFSKYIHRQIEEFAQKIKLTSLASWVIAWTERNLDAQYDTIFSARYLKMMQVLLERKYISIASSQKKLVLLQDFAKVSAAEVIDSIRCTLDWSVAVKEDYVLFYRNFASWLSKHTLGLIPQTMDVDRNLTIKRKLPFDMYIKVIDRLDLREQILAKIFYLGGRRQLDEVMSLKVEDIDFEHHRIRFSEGAISFPKHLIVDIERHVKDRQQGLIFIGKEGERIAYTTPLRLLKVVILSLQLDPEFTFKTFAVDS